MFSVFIQEFVIDSVYCLKYLSDAELIAIKFINVYVWCIGWHRVLFLYNKSLTNVFLSLESVWGMCDRMSFCLFSCWKRPYWLTICRDSSCLTLSIISLQASRQPPPVGPKWVCRFLFPDHHVFHTGRLWEKHSVCTVYIAGSICALKYTCKCVNIYFDLFNEWNAWNSAWLLCCGGLVRIITCVAGHPEWRHEYCWWYNKINNENCKPGWRGQAGPQGRVAMATWLDHVKSVTVSTDSKFYVNWPKIRCNWDMSSHPVLVVCLIQ